MDVHILMEMMLNAGTWVLRMWARYFIVCGGAFLLFWVLFADRLRHRRIQDRPSSRQQHTAEIKSSLTGMLGLLLPSILAIPAYEAGYLKLYLDPAEHGLWVLPVSFVALIVAVDTYYYWAHYLMHNKRAYRWLHKVHHTATNPSPLSAYSFALGESVILGMIVPLALLIAPINIWVLAAYVLWFALAEAYVHLGYEMMPNWWARNPLTRWLTTATYHNMHHQYFRYNYAVYFTFWDRVMGTMHPEYVKRFETITAAHANTEQTTNEIVGIQRAA